MIDACAMLCHSGRMAKGLRVAFLMADAGDELIEI
jgi:hypothetical protein